MVPPQFTPSRGPHGILTDPQAVSGPTRLRLLTFPFQRSHSERNSTPRFSLPCTKRQLSGRTKTVCTGFHHCVFYMCTFVFRLVYHFSAFKSIRNFKKIPSRQTIFLGNPQRFRAADAEYVIIMYKHRTQPCRHISGAYFGKSGRGLINEKAKSYNGNVIAISDADASASPFATVYPSLYLNYVRLI